MAPKTYPILRLAEKWSVIFKRRIKALPNDGNDWPNYHMKCALTLQDYRTDLKAHHFGPEHMAALPKEVGFGIDSMANELKLRVVLFVRVLMEIVLGSKLAGNPSHEGFRSAPALYKREAGDLLHLIREFGEKDKFWSLVLDAEHEEMLGSLFA